MGDQRCMLRGKERFNAEAQQQEFYPLLRLQEVLPVRLFGAPQGAHCWLVTETTEGK
jgi:hypothetical protein